MLEITNWNISPNQDWYVKLSDTGTAILVQLYLTSSDASAGTNLQASGSSTGYGSDLDVVLSNEETATHPVSLFQEEYEYHLQVSGSSGDTAKTYKVAEFVELPSISAPIYRSEELIPIKALSEINAHTHVSINRTINLGVHLPIIEISQIANIVISGRSIDVMGQLDNLEITGQTDEDGNSFLVNSLEITQYLEITK